MPISASWSPSAHLDRPLEQEPHVAFAALERLNDGLIALTAGAEGALARLIAGRPAGQGRSLSRPARSAVSRAALHRDLSRRHDPVEEAAEDALIDLAYARDLPLVATNPAAYADPALPRRARRDAVHCQLGLCRKRRPRDLVAPTPGSRTAAAMAGVVRRFARSAREHRGHRAALRGRRRRSASRSCRAWATTRTSSFARDAHAGLDVRLAGRSRRGRAPRYRERLDYRARRHHRHGLCRLLPDRRRLHQMGEGERHSGRAGPRLGRRLGRRLGADHHRPRSARARPAVRALPQSRARVDARLRHRFLRNPPRQGHHLRPAASTAATRSPRSSPSAD